MSQDDPRRLRIYTRTGDEGRTGLFGGARVLKSHLRVEAYGGIDELNANLGRAIPLLRDPASRSRLARVQHDLFAIGAHLATPPSTEGTGVSGSSLPPFPEARVSEMERWMDEGETRLPPLRAFILPGGSPGAAELHLSRTVCRRVERGVVLLAEEEGSIPGGALRYLNRLSDLLFVLARLENALAGEGDIEWQKEDS